MALIEKAKGRRENQSPSGYNALTKEEIYNGLKKKFSMDEIMTGQELCLLFGIDYSEIIKIRTSDQQSNLEYFINQVLGIEAIKAMISKRLSGFKKS